MTAHCGARSRSRFSWTSLLFRLAGRDSSLKERQPPKAAAESDYRWLSEAVVNHYHGDDADMRLSMGAVESAFEDMSVEAFGSEVLTWLGTASHSALHRGVPAERVVILRWE